MKLRFARSCGVFAAAALLAATLSGCYFLPKEEEILEPPLKVPEAVAYKTYEVTTGTIARYLSGSGKFESTQSESLYYRSGGGRIREIHVKSGDDVKAGDLIVELDTGDLEYTIFRQEKAVRAAELSLEVAKRSASPNAIAVERAQINYELAARELEKTRRAYNAAGGAKKDALKDDIYKQELNLKLLKMTLDEAKTPSKSAEADVERAQINYDLAAAQLEQYTKQLEESRLYASIDGTVIYVASLEPGDSVGTYYDIVKIADSDKLRITMQVSDMSDLDDYPEVGSGTELDVTYKKTEETVTGRIVQLPSDVPVTAPDSERKAVKIEVDSVPKGTRVGDAVNINLMLEEKTDVIVLPARYVSSYSARRYVRVLNEEGVPEERDVKLGIQSNNQVEIVSGLEAGEVIVI